MSFIYDNSNDYNSFKIISQIDKTEPISYENKDLNVNIKINVFNQYLSPKKYSKNWIKLKNLIKTVSKFYNYEAIPIKEIDIEGNLKDYKERLFPYSPLKKKIRNLKRCSSNRNMKRNLYLLNDNDNQKQSKESINNNREKGKILNLQKKISSPNKIKDVLKLINIKEENNVNLKKEESEDDNITIEMKKINTIERIKNYIIE